MSAATEKMRAEGLPDIAVETFAHYERLLEQGDQGVIRESEIEPLDELPGRRRAARGGQRRRSTRRSC